MEGNYRYFNTHYNVLDRLPSTKEASRLFRSKLKTIFLAAAITFMAISLIVYPQEALNASIRGLKMWWEIVFPSLLPFFIVSELLIGFGVVKFIGVILEPLMRPIFKVPGVGGFVLAMGWSSGNPAGAKFSARLRQEGQLSQIEAERLVSFTNSSNPLFIFGAVSVGFFHNPKLGMLLALAHYLGNIAVGVIMRFYGKETPDERKGNRLNIRAAFSALHQTRIKDNRPIGKLLGDAVQSSFQTLLMVGGFIILFSVINQLLYHLHITAALAKIVEVLFSFLSFPDSLSIPFISGLFEITLGSKLTSEVQDATLLQQAILTSFILGFGGFSVQAQVGSILAQTDIRFKPFFIARIMQGIFAGIFTVIFWNPVYIKLNGHEQSSHGLPVLGNGEPSQGIYQRLVETGPLITIISLCFYVLFLYLQIKNQNMKKS